MTDQQPSRPSFDGLRAISGVATEYLEQVLSSLGLDYVVAENAVVLPCPVHGGDNPTGCRAYTNSAFGYWQCHTRGCERIFRDDTFGMVRGIISRQRYNWNAEGDRKATLGETISFIRRSLGIKGEGPNIVVDHSRREFVNQTRRLAVEDGVEGKWCRKTIRSRMDVPSRFFLGRGFSYEVLDRFDVGETQTGPFAGRAVVPVYDHTGRMAVGFSARATTTNQTPKWLHSRFSRARILYNMHSAFQEARRTGTIILVEGPADVWRLWEAGYHNAAALLGISLTDAQQVLLEASGASKVVVFLDDDEAGRSAAMKIVGQLSRCFRVVIAHAGHGFDPADLTPAQLKEILERLR